MKPARKMLLILLCAVMIFTLLPAPAYAAAANDRQAVRKQTALFLKSIQKYNQKSITNCFQSGNTRKSLQLFKKNTKQAAVVRSLHKKDFSCKIKSVSVKGKTASVKIKATYYAGYSVFESAFWDFTAYFSDHPGISNSATDKKMASYEKKYIKKAGAKTVTRTIKIPLIKKNGTWKIKKMTAKMDDLVNCQFIRALNDISEKYT